MTASLDPSDLLVALVGALRAIMAAGDPASVARLFEDSRSIIPSDGTVEAWTMPAEHILQRDPIVKAAAMLPSIPAEMEAIAAVLAAIHILDQWHGPLVDDLSGERKSFQPGHAEIAARFDREQRFNTDPGKGVLVPRYDPDWRRRPDGEVVAAIEREYAGEIVRGLDIGRHLACTSLIPPELEVSHPDGGVGKPRRVTVRYVRPPASLATVARPEVHRVMVAPILETADDVAVTVTPDGNAYLVRPRNMSARVARVLENAYASEATVIFMPEMVLTSDGLNEFRKALADRHADYVQAHDFELPALCWVVAGVLEERAVSSHNHVVVMTADGEIVADQDKITRWNMTVDEQQQYSLDPPNGHVRPDFLQEPIEPAAILWLIDLPSLGRLAILVCADMDVPEPGDWLYANSGLDWIYAPIMDRTRVPMRTKGSVGPWIVRRAHRAACAAGAKAVVTNSMSLTPIVNATNVKRGLDAKYPPETHCHVGLLLDATSDQAVYMPVAVSLTATDVAEVRRWNENWEPFLKN